MKSFTKFQIGILAFFSLLISFSAQAGPLRLPSPIPACDQTRLLGGTTELQWQFERIENAIATPEDFDPKLFHLAGQGGNIPGYTSCSGSERGIASVYGIPGRDNFVGKRTASGDIMRAGKMRAAMLRSASVRYPLGTWVRVSKGGQSVLVCINDTGGGKRGRIIDLTSASANAIDNGDLGQVQVDCVAKPTRKGTRCDDSIGALLD